MKAEAMPKFLKMALKISLDFEKLPYRAANYLLVNLLNSLTFEDSDPSDEIT
jgi:hypothetical protein